MRSGFPLFAPVLFGLLLTLPIRVGAADEWERFKKTFITEDGRVVDFYQGQSSHSEGQGFAMLVAASRDDKETFEKLWQWARSNLQVRSSDKLFAWSWGQVRPDRWSVIDFNNATDGDTAIALALLDAADRWGIENYRDRAVEIIQSIRENVIVGKNGTFLVLPGYYGFQEGKTLILNPSYFLFSAYKRFAEADRKDFWLRVHKDSTAFLKRCLFGRFKLPADWVAYDGENVSIFMEKDPLFGYDAIRVLLYLRWDDNIGALKELGGCLDLIEKVGFVPLYFNPAKNSMSLDEAPAGFYAIFSRCAFELQKTDLGKYLWKQAEKKLSEEERNYYSWVLYLLAKVDRTP